jgi:hypothetical protein
MNDIKKRKIKITERKLNMFIHFRKSKVALKKGEKVAKADDTEFDCETHISDGRSKQKLRQKSKKASPSIKEKRSRTPLEKLFKKTKKSKTPSPTPSSIVDIPKEVPDDDTTSSISSSMSSDWSTSTYPDSNCSVKSKELINPIQRRQSMPISNISSPTNEIKHRSCVESFYLGREHVPQSSGTKLSLAKIKEENKTSQQTKRNDIKPTGKSKQVLQNVRKMIKDQSIQEQHFNDTRQKESVRL